MFRLLAIVVALGLASAQECGQKPNAGFIIGGEDASENEWPWQLSMQRGTFHFCGASLIYEDWAITASHCVEAESPGSFTIVAGEHDRNTPTGNEQRMDVAAIFMHPDYNFPDNDVAVVRFTEPVTFNDVVSPACPPVEESRDNPDLYADDDIECWISGWGDTGSGAAIILQHVQMDVWTDAQCVADIGNYENVYCIKGLDGSGEGACFGDSGGPMSCNRGDGQWELIGAASFVFGQCNTDEPTGYASLPGLWSWIEETIEDNPAN